MCVCVNVYMCECVCVCMLKNRDERSTYFTRLLEGLNKTFTNTGDQMTFPFIVCFILTMPKKLAEGIHSKR